MKLTQKLVLGFIAVSLFSAIVGYVGFASIKIVDNTFESMTEQSTSLTNSLKDLKISTLTAFSLIVGHALICEDAATGDEVALINKNKEELEQSFRKYMALFEAYFPEETELKISLRQSFFVFISGYGEFIELKNKGASEEEILKTYNDFEKSKEAFLETLNDVELMEMQDIEERKDVIEGTINKSLISILIIIITSMISAVICGIFFARFISRPVIELTKASVEVCGIHKNMKKPLRPPKDEVEELRESFNKMILDIKEKNEEISLKNTELEKSKKELEKKVEELEQFNKLVIGRELKMIELKKKIRMLEKKK